MENHHSPTDGKTFARIVKVANAGDEKTIADWSKSDTPKPIGTEVEVTYVNTADNDSHNGSVAMHFSTPSGIVRLD